MIVESRSRGPKLGHYFRDRKSLKVQHFPGPTEAVILFPVHDAHCRARCISRLLLCALCALRELCV